MIEYREETLENGIRVIMHRKPEIPSVVINSAFHTGSKNEEKNKTGLSHLLEHLMFSGSKNIPENKFDEILHTYGGESNAFTSQDYTSYYLTIPSSNIEVGMWLDSDRFVEFPVTQKYLDVQKKVVMEEKLQVHDNTPYGSYDYESLRRLFPASSYGWQIIGDENHIAGFTLDDVREYYEKYYSPDNMILTVAGDIEYGKTLELIKKYYADIPKGKNGYKKFIFEDTEVNECEESIEDNITLPARFELYRIPQIGTKEYYALKLLSIALSSGESSRIYEKLIKSNISGESYCAAIGMESAGIFVIHTYMNANKKTEEAGRVVTEILEEIKSGGLSEKEIIKTLNKIKTSYYIKVQSLLNIVNTLIHCKIYYNNCEKINTEIKEYEKITNADIKSAAENFLRKDKRIILNYVPKAGDNDGQE